MTRLPPDATPCASRLFDDALKAHQTGCWNLQFPPFVGGNVVLQRCRFNDALEARAAIITDPGAAPFSANLDETQGLRTLLGAASNGTLDNQTTLHIVPRRPLNARRHRNGGPSAFAEVAISMLR